MPSYDVAEEVETIARALIKKHHPNLDKVMVGYLFRDKAPVGNGRVVYGMTVRVDDRNHVFNSKDVIIEISRDTWGLLSEEMKNYVVDHELSHIGLVMNKEGTSIELTESGRPRVFVKPHDFEDFHAVQDWYPDGRVKMQAVTKKIIEQMENAKKAARASSKTKS